MSVLGARHESGCRLDSFANALEPERIVYASLAGALVLLHFCFFARRDNFRLLSIAFFARRESVGQVGNLRPIVNRPTFGGWHNAGGRPTQFAVCRYAGQVV
jgi:hypothetical protein